ncbi:amino acid permease [Criblamydia sequanensis]|uniref:Tryptophan/tyrosine permease n=1 Tax=Candidatus Criblamydia sequanensis CRIB-18 TaxID=1437425 RepID=A0A090CZ48_9BACT|nr:aromatic amino acid transport family protein [Criblamydia sequanensis]CDR34167.1 Tryptophan/tyrosine permease [Criblamydia sequanensis CRIB-18]
MTQTDRMLKGALLVAGTSIGGGMLALPVETFWGGFLPSIVIYFICWALMASTGLLILETSLWMHEESNLVSMAEKTTGSYGKIFAWVLYLFLFYMLTLAYVTGCGGLLRELFHNQISEKAAPWIFAGLFAPFIFSGPRVVSKLNVFLMAGLFIFYFAFVYFGISHIKIDLLKRIDISKSLIGLPVAFTAFAYQGIVPTLFGYLKHDAKATRKAILIGSSLPFFAYVLWQGLIMGIVPPFGEGSLSEAHQLGQNAVYPLKGYLQDPRIYVVGQFFSFFALITSFFGVTLGLLDFLADGLKVRKTPKGRFLLCLATLMPPLLITLYNPNLFLSSLSLAGGFGCALLLGLLPVVMVYKGRYEKKFEEKSYRFPGGKGVLIFIAAFILFEVLIEILILIGVYQPNFQ